MSYWWHFFQVPRKRSKIIPPSALQHHRFDFDTRSQWWQRRRWRQFLVYNPMISQDTRPHPPQNPQVVEGGIKRMRRSCDSFNKCPLSYDLVMRGTQGVRQIPPSILLFPLMWTQTPRTNWTRPGLSILSSLSPIAMDVLSTTKRKSQCHISLYLFHLFMHLYCIILLKIWTDLTEDSLDS